jgi:hypothetical protein
VQLLAQPHRLASSTKRAASNSRATPSRHRMRLRKVPDGTEHFPRKPERIVALSLVMVLCLLVYRLAEDRLREQLAATGQTVPSQLKTPTGRPTMRWVFPCLEGANLLRIRHGPDPAVALVRRLQPFQH